MSDENEFIVATPVERPTLKSVSIKDNDGLLMITLESLYPDDHRQVVVNQFRPLTDKTRGHLTVLTYFDTPDLRMIRDTINNFLDE